MEPKPAPLTPPLNPEAIITLPPEIERVLTTDTSSLDFNHARELIKIIKQHHKEIEDYVGSSKDKEVMEKLTLIIQSCARIVKDYENKVNEANPFLKHKDTLLKGLVELEDTDSWWGYTAVVGSMFDLGILTGGEFKEKALKALGHFKKENDWEDYFKLVEKLVSTGLANKEDYRDDVDRVFGYYNENIGFLVELSVLDSLFSLGLLDREEYKSKLFECLNSEINALHIVLKILVKMIKFGWANKDDYEAKLNEILEYAKRNFDANLLAGLLDIDFVDKDTIREVLKYYKSVRRPDEYHFILSKAFPLGFVDMDVLEEALTFYESNGWPGSQASLLEQMLKAGIIDKNSYRQRSKIDEGLEFGERTQSWPSYYILLEKGLSLGIFKKEEFEDKIQKGLDYYIDNKNWSEYASLLLATKGPSKDWGV